MDTRKQFEDVKFEIYVFIKTDHICENCKKINSQNSKYRETTEFIESDGCICGQYVNVRSYINSLLELVKDKINEK